MKRFPFPLLLLLGLGACAAPQQKTQEATAPGPEAVPAATPYDQTFRWKDWRLRLLEKPETPGPLKWYAVTAGRGEAGPGSLPEIRTEMDADDGVAEAWVVDVNHNGWPDLVVATRTAGSGGFGYLRILECHPRGFRVLPSPKASAKQLEGYRGGDTWRLDHQGLWRFFPVYQPQDADHHPTGGRRILRFNWEKGRWRMHFNTERP